MKGAAGKFEGWARYPSIQAQVFPFRQECEVSALLAQDRDYIVYGRGRSYGDSALNDSLLSSCRFNRFLEFDEESGTLECQAGTSLREIIEVFLPRGWFLPVTPGTKHVSVGGAVAADVHGKNHHLDGSFCDFVSSLRLMLPGGEVVDCSREQNPRLFHATCGGMGLTGVILSVRFRLRRVRGDQILQTSIRARDFSEVVDLFRRFSEASYSVAWIDCLASGCRLGRSILLLGEHCPEEGYQRHRPRTVRVPFSGPSWALNRYSLRLFNALYYHLKGKADGSPERVSIDSFFYPLDTVEGWNKLYGRRGFLQYQCVLPEETAEKGLPEVLRRVAASGEGSFLAVLKAFGPGNRNCLSFPQKGLTLALDFRRKRGVLDLLDSLDELLIEYGGRLYLAKDSRMSREVFRRGYPRWREFLAVRKEHGLQAKFNSLQSRRLGL